MTLTKKIITYIMIAGIGFSSFTQQGFGNEELENSQPIISQLEENDLLESWIETLKAHPMVLASGTTAFALTMGILYYMKHCKANTAIPQAGYAGGASKIVRHILRVGSAGGCLTREEAAAAAAQLERSTRALLMRQQMQFGMYIPY